MADDRPALDPTEQLAALQKTVDDLRSTVLARASRLPTGSLQPVFLTAAPPDTLLLQGQTVSRATYAVLWKWVTDNALNGTGSGKMFGNGDGSTTFTLPDARGRVLRGVAATGEAVGDLLGADSRALTSTNLPGHTHTFTTAGAGNHGHSYSTDGSGTHGGHFPAGGPNYAAPQAGALGLAAWNDGGSSGGFHSHTGGTTNVADHTHTGTTASTGSGAAVDMRQASINVNVLIWT